MVVKRKETRAICRDVMSIVWEDFVLWHTLVVFPHAKCVLKDGGQGVDPRRAPPSEPGQQFLEQRRAVSALGRIGPESIDHRAIHADAVG